MAEALKQSNALQAIAIRRGNGETEYTPQANASLGPADSLVILVGGQG